MTPGSLFLTELPESHGGKSKLRPAIALAELPGLHGDWLMCGSSSRVSHYVSNWDEIIRATDADFPASGLHRDTLFRLSFLHAMHPPKLTGYIGQITPDRLERLLLRLSDHLRP